MKKISWIGVLLMLITFSGCFDTVEELTIKENGGGTFVNILDMGKVLELAKTMGGGKDEMKEFEKMKLDTVVNLKDIKDSLKRLNDAEKKIVSTGTLRVQADGTESKMNFTFTFPFSNPSQIDQIQGVLKKAKGDVLDDIMTTLMGEGGKKNDMMMGDEDSDDQGDEMGANLDGYYTSVYEKGKIIRKLNKEKYANVNDDKSLKSLQEMSQLGIPINMKTVINLPRPAIKAEGKGVKLSEDKKKITMEGTLDDFFEDGSYFEYNIEY